MTKISKLKYQLLLGILDNIHDFGNKCTLSFILKKHFYCFIELIGLKNEIIGNSKDQEIKNLYEIAVNGTIKEELILKIILEKFADKSQNTKKLNKQIIKNFEKIFPETNLEKLNIIKLRHLIYVLIANESKRDITINLINEIISNVYGSEKYSNKQLKKIIKNFNELEITENVTYPMTYFDDMTKGLENKANYDYHIINLDKKFIDGADTTSPQKQLYDRIPNKKSNNILVKSSSGQFSVGFIVKRGKDGDTLEYYKTNYYLDFDNKITCEFLDKINSETYLIQIKLLSNEILFISNLVEIICNIIDDYWTLIYTKKFNNFKLYNWDFTHIVEQNYAINFINQIYKYILAKNNFDNKITEENEKFVKSLENKHLCQGMVVYILVGAKRFGDWIQMQLS